MESFSITNETVEKIAAITGIKITDDYSFDLAIHRLIQKCDIGRENVAFLQKRLIAHGIKPY